jgi:hypothetical protein
MHYLERLVISRYKHIRSALYEKPGYDSKDAQQKMLVAA